RRRPGKPEGARRRVRLSVFGPVLALLVGLAVAAVLVSRPDPVQRDHDAPVGTCAQNCAPAARTTQEEDSTVNGYGNGQGNGYGNGNGNGNFNGNMNGNGNVIVNGRVVTPGEAIEPALAMVHRLLDSILGGRR